MVHSDYSIKTKNKRSW